MSNVSSTTMSRRDFAKVAGGALVALAAGAVACGATTGEALADTTGTCTCNVRVKPTGMPAVAIGTSNYAYLTNATTPSGITGPFPTEPVSNNATYIDNGNGYWTVTVPLVNTMFTLRKIDSSCSSHADATIDTNAGFNGTNYDYLVVTMPASSGTHKFGATEYASFSLYSGTKTWDVEVVLSI